MRRTFTLFVALAMLILGAAPALANNTWNGYHWAGGATDPHDGSITLALVNDLSDYKTQYSNVVGDWDGAPGPLTLNSVLGGTRPAACDNVATDAAGDAILGTIHVCNDAYGQNGWLGLARIWLASDGHIDAAVALMNDSYFQVQGSVYDDAIAQRHVLCQEIGHTFGLDHQKGPKNHSCMNDQWGLTDTSFQSPNQHDFDTLKEIYGSSGSGGGDSNTCNPKRPNCPANGQNVQVASRPGGGWIVTFTVPAG